MLTFKFFWLLVQIVILGQRMTFHKEMAQHYVEQTRVYMLMHNHENKVWCVTKARRHTRQLNQIKKRALELLIQANEVKNLLKQGR